VEPQAARGASKPYAATSSVGATGDTLGSRSYGVPVMHLLLPALTLADLNGHMDWDGGWGVVMVIGMVLFWALLIAGAVWLVREFARDRGPQRGGADNDPLQILDRRLADGSISADDYEARRAMLDDTGGRPGPSDVSKPEADLPPRPAHG